MAKPARPTDCNPDVCDLARKFCMLGATDDDLAELLEVEPATIADWIAGFPDFAMALKQGREIADATAAERLFQRAIGFSHEVEKVVQSGGKPLTVKYTEHYPPDTTALVFWLKNRQRGRWRDKVEPEPDTVSNEALAELEAAGIRARNLARDWRAAAHGDSPSSRPSASSTSLGAGSVPSGETFPP
jgi:hypothetical protein